MAHPKDGTRPASRYSRGKRRRPFDPGLHDYEGWLWLHPEWGYTHLPTDYWSALSGRGKRGRTRMLDACCEPHYYLERRDMPFKASVLTLGRAGVTKLIEEGKLSEKPHRPRSPFAHELGDCICEAQMEIGAKKYPDLSYTPWRTIMKSELLPASTRALPDPFAFEPTPGKKHKFDGRTFQLRRGQTSIGFFREFDRNTEDLWGAAKITIEKKVENIAAIWKEKLYRRFHRRALVLFVTVVDYRRPDDPYHRQRELMQVVKSVIGPCDYILFQTVHDYTTAGFSVKCSTELMDRPWLRVGFPGFSLNKLEDVPVSTPSYV